MDADVNELYMPAPLAYIVEAAFDEDIQGVIPNIAKLTFGAAHLERPIDIISTHRQDTLVVRDGVMMTMTTTWAHTVAVQRVLQAVPRTVRYVPGHVKRRHRWLVTSVTDGFRRNCILPK